MTPQALKNSILQLAIQGKLVEQRPEEGTGKDLFQQIQEEKRELVKAGKIKKEKPLLEITEDEIPFDIPENWIWARFGDICTIDAGGTPDRNTTEYWDGNIPWVKIGDIRGKYVNVQYRLDGEQDATLAMLFALQLSRLPEIKERIHRSDAVGYLEKNYIYASFVHSHQTAIAYLNNNNVTINPDLLNDNEGKTLIDRRQKEESCCQCSLRLQFQQTNGRIL